MTETLAFGDYRTISSQLKELGFLNDDTLIMVMTSDVRSVFCANGALSLSDTFDGVDAAYGVLTSAKYSLEYSRLGRPVTASTDDMAMMFGGSVECVDKAEGCAPAYLLKDRGFLVTGRSVSEVVASCVLMEKMCEAALLGH